MQCPQNYFKNRRKTDEAERCFGSDVRVNPTQSGDKVKAYASVNIGGAFAIKNIRIIIKGSKGLFVAMPSVKNHKGEYDDIFFPHHQGKPKSL